jgi:hypothetical protein
LKRRRGWQRSPSAALIVVMLFDLKQILNYSMLFIAGVEDKKFCDLAMRLKSSCPQGHTQFVKKAGHAAHLENGPMTAESITIFFSALLQKTSHSFQYPLEGCKKQEIVREV